MTRIYTFFNLNEIKELVFNISQQHSRLHALQLQGRLSTELKKLERGGKTSFSSKYLHFHFPDRFFIYDSRANKALPYLKSYLEAATSTSITYRKNEISLEKIGNGNVQYVDFENKCEVLKKGLESLGIFCSNRQFDSVLLLIANYIIRFENKNKVKKGDQSVADKRSATQR